MNIMPNAMVNLLINYFYCFAQNVSFYGLKPIQECQGITLACQHDYFILSATKKNHEKKDVEMSVMDGEFSVEEF